MLEVDPLKWNETNETPYPDNPSQGLCVHGQYVYVTDVTSHCVFVFTTDGRYVTSFGQTYQKREILTVLILFMLITTLSFAFVI